MPFAPCGRTLIAAISLSLTAVAPAWSQPAHAWGASKPIPDRYIVVFKDSVGNPAAEAGALSRAAGGQLHHTYSAAIKGFAATLPAAALPGLRNNPNVDYIEQDQTVSLTGTQANATWGLDRIDQRIGLDGSYQYNVTGSGVHAFIIDTGIRWDHQEFAGRLLKGETSINDGRGTEDCNGHGTHVAGTVGGTTWGVAKQVKLIPVRVLDCRGSGSWSGVIAGVDWVAAQKLLRPAVGNMSLGGGLSSSVNAAVAGAVSSGVAMVVAAGNSNADACRYSPASEPTAITVGATTNTDARASYSNWGTCLDIFAPGSSITSAWHTGSAATNTISGTSMASPHVAGAAALVLQSNPGASAAAVTSFLASNATPDRISSPGAGSPNLLLYSLGTTVPSEPDQIAVSSLEGKSSKAGKNNWHATATTGVRKLGDASTAVANATVTGSFEPGGTGSCVTGSNGSCSISVTLKPSATVTKFTVTNITATNSVYAPSQNSATETVIQKPLQ